MSNKALHIIQRKQPSAKKGSNDKNSSSYAGNVSLVTLGCAKNTVDSEIMLGSLIERGYEPVADPALADLIVVNTCAFLESAVKESIDRILELARYKEFGRCRRLVVAGCMVERYRGDLESQFPEVDRFISTDELQSAAEESQTTKECFDKARRPYFLYDESMPRVLSTGAYSAYVKIAEGCSRPCAFCIIPKLRGEFRSRALESILEEVQVLLQDGAREINLVAQDLTAYGSDLMSGKQGGEGRLLELLTCLGKFYSEKERFWIRNFYAYPQGISSELLQFMQDSPHVCSYFDIPLQHISERVLKSMKRPISPLGPGLVLGGAQDKSTRAFVERIREAAPELALRTTFLVGFPGEREEDVRELEEFVREGHFTHVGVFSYSQEEEAESFKHLKQVEEEEREKRRGRVMEAQQEVVARRLGECVGKELDVLLEGSHPETELLLRGRTEWQGPETDGEVIINDLAEVVLNERGEFPEGAFSGLFGRVRITEVQDYDLVGELVSVENEGEK